MECPFCRSNIPEEASVCKYCTRDIGLLIEARKEIALLTDRLANLSPKEESQLASWNWNKVIIIFQYLFVTLIFNLLIFHEGNIRDILIYSTTAFGGMGIVLFNSKTTNIWILFMIGFCEPMVYLTTYKIISGNNVELLKAFSAYISDAFITGASMACGGLIVSLILMAFDKKHQLNKDSISFDRFFKWVSAGHSMIGTFEDLILKIVSLLTAVAALAKALGKI